MNWCAKHIDLGKKSFNEKEGFCCKYMTKNLIDIKSFLLNMYP